MARGGKRSNSGRKSDSEISRFRELIDAAVTDADWLEIIVAAMKDAKAHDRDAGIARTFLVSYRFGLPTQLIGGDPEAAPIEVIEIVRPDARAIRVGEQAPADVSAPVPNGRARRKRAVHVDAGGHTGRKNKP